VKAFQSTRRPEAGVKINSTKNLEASVDATEALEK